MKKTDFHLANMNCIEELKKIIYTDSKMSMADSLSKFADEINVSPHTVRHWFTNNSQPSLNTAFTIQRLTKGKIKASHLRKDLFMGNLGVDG